MHMNTTPRCLTTLILMSLMACTTAPVKDTRDFKWVSLAEFVDREFPTQAPMDVAVPAHFNTVQFDSPGSSDNVYWMRPQDMKRADRSGDLPIEHGFMYGKITLNVGYDGRKDRFVGVEDQDIDQIPQQGIERYQMQRFLAGEHPVLLLSYTLNDKHIAGAYVATLIDSNVVYIAFRPANNDRNLAQTFIQRMGERLTPSP